MAVQSSKEHIMLCRTSRHLRQAGEPCRCGRGRYGLITSLSRARVGLRHARNLLRNCDGISAIFEG